MLCRQGRKLAGFITIVLHEDKVPQFNNIRVACVNQVPARAVFGQVDMNFAARAARACSTHFPEVVFFVAVMDMGRIDIGHISPEPLGFAVGIEAVCFIAAEYSRVEAVLGQAPNFRQELPRPLDGVFLEVVAKAPVAKHLKERVVVAVVADVFKVVVLAAGADALLAIGGSGVISRLLGEEDVFELVHPRIGK